MPPTHGGGLTPGVAEGADGRAAAHPQLWVMSSTTSTITSPILPSSSTPRRSVEPRLRNAPSRQRRPLSPYSMTRLRIATPRPRDLIPRNGHHPYAVHLERRLDQPVAAWRRYGTGRTTWRRRDRLSPAGGTSLWPAERDARVTCPTPGARSTSIPRSRVIAPRPPRQGIDTDATSPRRCSKRRRGRGLLARRSACRRTSASLRPADATLVEPAPHPAFRRLAPAL
jgi:hypothetical protein